MQYKKDFIKSDGRRLLKGGPRDQQIRTQTAAGSELVDTLINQIADLKSEVRKLEQGGASATPSNLYTAEQMDEEIRKAVSQTMAEATISLKKNAADPNLEAVIKTYKEQIVELQRSNDDFTRMHKVMAAENSEFKGKLEILMEDAVEIPELRKQVAILEQSLIGKEELIETLKTRPAIINGEIVSSEPVDPDRPQMEEVFVDPLEDDAGEGLKSSIKTRELTRDVEDGEMDSKVNKLKDLLGSKLPKNI
jgi:hypothetical protein